MNPEIKIAEPQLSGAALPEEMPDLLAREEEVSGRAFRGGDISGLACPDDRSPAETHPNPTCDDRAGFPYSRSFSGGCECVAGEIRSIKSFIGIEQYGLTAMFPNLTIVFGCICRLSMRIKIGR